MKTLWKTFAMGVAAVTLCAASAFGHGFGGRSGPGGMGPGRGMMFPALLRALDLSPEQRGQVEEIMKKHRANLEPLFKQIRAAHDDMGGRLLAPGAVGANDLSPTVEHLGQLHQQMMQEWVQAAVEARAVLTPAQLAKAAQIKQQLDGLRTQMKQLLGRAEVDEE